MLQLLNDPGQLVFSYATAVLRDGLDKYPAFRKVRGLVPLSFATPKIASRGSARALLRYWGSAGVPTHASREGLLMDDENATRQIWQRFERIFDEETKGRA